jgi:hypothetical protein
MPEAAMNEHRNAMLRKDEIGRSGQILTVQSKPKTERMRRMTDAHLRTGVPAFDP